MADFDLIVRNGTVVSPANAVRADVGVSEGRIVAVQESLATNASEVIEADGLYVFPGVIDPHVHFNEPGRAHWEGFATGSRALAAGGGTLFFDMPLNSHPPTLDGESFDRKLAAAQANSLTDFAFWGGMVPANLDKLTELHDRGVIAFKAFMCASGLDDFPHVDDETLRKGMKRIVEFGGLLAVHAESESMTRRLTEERLAQGRTSIRDFLDSRPVAAELEAIRRALDLAGETGCELHIVHVSCGEGVALIADARVRGVNVTCETCPHYLTLTEEDLFAIHAAAKCAPPLRSKQSQRLLWDQLLAGRIDFVASDHSPAPPEMKSDANFFKVWGGIAGVQHTLPLLLGEGCVRRNLSLPALSRLVSSNVAARFHLPPEKGELKIGGDAALALVDLCAEFQLHAEDLLDRHQFSPYVGRPLRSKVVRTLLRGVTIFNHGKIVSKPAGRLVKPIRR